MVTNNGKWETVSGKFIGEVQFRHSDGKKAFAAWRLDTEKKGIFIIKCFGAEAEKARDSLTESGQVVSVHGKMDPEEGSVILADFIQIRGAEETKGQFVSRLYGSRAKMIEAVNSNRKYKEAHGLVKTRAGYMSREACVQLASGEWIRKVDFLMDVFGGAQISAEMRKYFNFPMTEPMAAAYGEWVERKMEQAAKIVGFE